MSKNTLSSHYAKLMQEREAVLIELAHLRETIQSEVDLEPDEGDEQITEHETAAILIGILEHKLADLESVLTSIEQGAYSLCERCNKPIEAERLVAKPDARFCIKCQKAIERIVQQSHMPAPSIQWELFLEV